MKRLNVDDPRITAYALNELEASEKESVEALLDADLAAEIASIRGFGESLKEELKRAPFPTPDPQILQKVMAGKPKHSRFFFRLPLLWSGIATSLATVALIVGVWRPWQLAQDMNQPLTALSKPQQESPQQLDLYQQQAHAVEDRQQEMLEMMQQSQAAAPATATTDEQTTLSRQVPAGLKAMDNPQPGIVYAKRAAPQARFYDPGGYRLDGGGSIPDGESYHRIQESEFVSPFNQPLSTLSLHVNTASYANIRRFLNYGQFPPPDAVRIEEMVNYFKYDYLPPEGEHPFAVNVEVSEAPWNPAHRLVRIGLRAREIPWDKRPPSNLVFLIDVSGSMADQNKLPLIKAGLRLLVEKLGERDRVAIVVYATDAHVALPSTAVAKKEVILQAIAALQAHDSTNAGEGIQMAYRAAVSNFIKGGNNRVILATDGDFNVGITSEDELARLIEDNAKSGVYLSVLGVGMGNLKDATMEKLAERGHGNYAYIDSLDEAKRVLVREAGSSLFVVAKDVKAQVEFNPARVGTYRLIGYESHTTAAEHFNDDTKIANDIGPGHTVTVFYEITPPEKKDKPTVAPLKYQKNEALSEAAGTEELLSLKIRYKNPDGDVSKLLVAPALDRGGKLNEASRDFRFAASVAAFGMLLRNSAHQGNVTPDQIVSWAGEVRASEEDRSEFLGLVRAAKAAKAAPPVDSIQPVLVY